MEPFKQLTGVAAPLLMDNVDTDMIIPKQFLKTIKRSGLAEGLFYEMRWDEHGNKTDFVLDQAPYDQAKILVAGANFGCGSSREHAPWALLDFGIRCVIAGSYADIFYNNCFKNGVLPIALDAEPLKTLSQDAQAGETLSIDLVAQEIRRPNGAVIRFEVDGFRRHCMLNGLDDIGLTLKHDEAIATFEDRLKDERPWIMA